MREKKSVEQEDDIKRIIDVFYVVSKQIVRLVNSRIKSNGGRIKKNFSGTLNLSRGLNMIDST